jgi:hypothetical protein
VDDLLRVSEFEMSPGTAGYVLTSDASGVGTWQPVASGADSDWTISGNDMYSEVTGHVGVGANAPTAKLQVYTGADEQALRVYHDIGTTGQTVSVERGQLPDIGNDVLELKVPDGSGIGFQFLECQRGETVELKIEGDGYITSNEGGDFSGTLRNTGLLTYGTGYVSGSSAQQFEVSSSSVADGTKVLSGIATGSPTGSTPIGVYGESAQADGFGVGGKFVGGFSGVQGEVLATGSDAYVGVGGQATGGTGTNYGLKGYAAGGADNYGVYASVIDIGGTNYAGWFFGDVHVSGAFSATSKSFKIDHPLDPEGKFLVHSCVESDDMMNIYNGNVVLDEGGTAWVDMPDWFEALNADFRYQLTCIGGFAPVYVASEISGGRFQIAGGEPGMKVSWQVTGVRHDPVAMARPVSVEVDKAPNETGRYLNPEAYGQPVSMAIGFHEERDSSGPTSVRNEPPRAERESYVND